MNKLVQLLKDLCQLDGVSGAEDQVREYIKAQVEPYCETATDNRGNLICYKKGAAAPKNKVMFSAHMDEVGFIITKIDSDGFLRFSTVGGIDSRVVIGKPVRLENGTPGVVGTKPIHVQTAEEKDTPLKISEMYIDIGAASKEDALKYVQPGDRAVFASDFMEFGSGRVKAKALDDRAGCAALIALLQQDSPVDYTVVFTVCEECGKMGAGNAAYSVEPDIAVAVEVTAAADVSGVDELDQICIQGQGPCLSFMDGGTIYDRRLFKEGLAIAARHSIPCQIKTATTGGNESHDVQTAAAGARVMAVSLPGRYIHSASSIIKVGDLEHLVALLAVYANELGNL